MNEIQAEPAGQLTTKDDTEKLEQSLAIPRLQYFTTAERKRFLDSFDIVFCDCDGVLWRTLRDAIPGAAQAIAALRDAGKRIVYVTNNSIISTEDHLRKFQACGIQLDKADLWHPAQTVSDYLRLHNFNGLILCQATQPFRQLLRTAGFQLVAEEEPRAASGCTTAADFHAAIFVDEPVQAVVMDVDFNLTAARMMRCHVHLRRQPDCLFIGGAADMVVPFGAGDVLGPGAFINAIEQSTQRQATILGKPGSELGRMLKQRYELVEQPQRALFIGDSLASDVRFGKLCGFQTLLVLSGATEERELLAISSLAEMPDLVADSLPEFVEMLLSQ